MTSAVDWEQANTSLAGRRERDVPFTSFPGLSPHDEDDGCNASFSKAEITLEEKLKPLLIVSDASECNNNLSCFLKEAVDGLYGIQFGCPSPSVSSSGSTTNLNLETIPDTEPEFQIDAGAPPKAKNYQRISTFALKLITSNLFTKNYILCIGKILGLLSVLSHSRPSDEDSKYEGECLKEFLCITVLLMLKTSSDKDNVDSGALFEVLEDLNFVGIIFGFLTTHIRHINEETASSSASSSSYIILKFVCDIVFEYLFQVEHLSDNEFQMLSLETDLIPTIIQNLLENDNFNNYDITDDNNPDDQRDEQDWANQSKVIAYEEFKLLLLINEQYLMKSYTNPEIKNKVFTTLLEQQDDSGSGSNISGFINMVVCYLNREESQILKILILKFLYLIFTTSFTSKLFYLNDLKILVDIFIRELNNMDYSSGEMLASENRLLTITYLKVMYPLLMFSQLNELENGYKNEEIIDLLRYLILNSKSSNGTPENAIKTVQEEQEEVIAKLSMRCLSVKWLKKATLTVQSTSTNQATSPTTPIPISNLKPAASSPHSSSVSSNSSLNYLQKARPELYQRSENSSQESIGAAFTRIASVRTSTKNDFHRITTTHNLSNVNTHDNIVANNNNVFLARMNSLTINNSSTEGEQKAESKDENNILNLPVEYLEEKRSASPYSSLVRKAILKKAPPPPPSARRGDELSSTIPSRSPVIQIAKGRLNAPLPSLPSPPPPPPPRRRR